MRVGKRGTGDGMRTGKKAIIAAVVLTSAMAGGGYGYLFAAREMSARLSVAMADVRESLGPGATLDCGNSEVRPLSRGAGSSKQTR